MSPLNLGSVKTVSVTNVVSFRILRSKCRFGEFHPFENATLPGLCMLRWQMEEKETIIQST